MLTAISRNVEKPRDAAHKADREAHGGALLELHVRVRHAPQKYEEFRDARDGKITI